MEGIITTLSGQKRAIISPLKNGSPPKKMSTFVGLSPMEKKLAQISTPTDRPFRVSIEGNIGAGKSTLINYFSGMEGIETYPEPIDMWRNCHGHNLLELLYKDIGKWYNTFQMYVQLTRLKVQTSKPTSSNTTVQMFERSVQNNRFCFVEQAHKSGLLHDADYAVLDKWYRWMRESTNIDLDLIVYLRSTPEIVYDRTMRRARPEETGISLEYLKQLHDAHERWLMTDDERFNTIPVLVLNADKALEDICEQYRQNEKKILGYDKISRTIVKREEREKVKKVLIKSDN